MVTNHVGGRGAVLLVFIWALLSARPLAGLAQTPIVLPAGDAPVVRVMMRSGKLSVRIWNRTDVQVSSALTVTARSFRPEAVARALSGSVPIFATSVFPESGPITLPPEQFSLASMPPGPHVGVLVQAVDGDLTVTIPAGAALLLANVQRGGIDVQDYRGAFVLLLHNGPMRLRSIVGSGYAQVARGPIMARDSTFDHLRARTAVGNIFFENCVSREIQVTSVTGTIIYDNGSFQPGLARFESDSGSVALGIGKDGARVGAHSSVGRIFSVVNGSSVRAGQTDAQVGNGRAVVTASSSHGAIYLYNGSLRTQQRLPAAWGAVVRFIPRRSPPQRIPHGRIH